jgi:hypothetical protein
MSAQFKLQDMLVAENKYVIFNFTPLDTRHLSTLFITATKQLWYSGLEFGGTLPES